MKRFSHRKGRYISSARIDAFIEDLVKVCQSHGMSLGHEDSHGAFIVHRMNDENLKWLRAAQAGDVEE